MNEPERRRLTVEEYLALESMSAERLEYRGGLAVALATPTGNHLRIAGNLVMTLGPLARAGNCDFSAGDAKVVTPSGDRLIPDFVITCDKRDRSALDERGEAIVRYPWLVVEILSPSTAADDLSEKLDAYRSIPELTHYVLIDSCRRAVRLYERVADGFLTCGPVELLCLPHLVERGMSIDDVYRDTTVPLIESTRHTI